MNRIMNKEHILKNIKVHNSDITDEYLNYVINSKVVSIDTETTELD
jgi:hypothetical protein